MPLSNRGFPVLATEIVPGASHVHIREARITKCAKNRALSRDRRPDRNGELIVIDTPPNGSVVDEAIKTADFVVIPTLSSPIDLQQTMLTAAQCQDAGKDYAVLIVMARKGTNALRAFRTAVEEYGAGIFDTEIPLREDFKADFGHTSRSNLNGYEDVWNELKEELR